MGYSTSFNFTEHSSPQRNRKTANSELIESACERLQQPHHLPISAFLPAAKLLISLCDTIDGSPPGATILGGLPFPSPMRESEVSQSRPTLHNPMNCSLPGSSIHGIFQTRVLEQGAIAFSSFPVYPRHKKTTSYSHGLATPGSTNTNAPSGLPW